MLYRDPKCVFVSNDFGRADVVAAWLDAHGIPAEVMNQATLGGFISPLLVGASGVEVWVVDPAQAPEAIRLLGDHTVAQLVKRPTGPPLAVVCEECGKTTIFPAAERGSVQECSHCAAYLDVESSEGEELPDSSEPEESGGERHGTDAITDKGPGGFTAP